MNAGIRHGASPGAHELNSHRGTRLGREDQAALEVGFAPGAGLSWRRRRVQQLRESIERGGYEVDPHRVADALLSRLGATP